MLSTESSLKLIDAINKMDIMEKIEDIIEQGTKLANSKVKSSANNKSNKNMQGDIAMEVGLTLMPKIAMLFVMNIGKAREEIFEVVSDMQGVSVEEVKKQHIAQTINTLKENISIKEFTDFFTLLKG